LVISYRSGFRKLAKLETETSGKELRGGKEKRKRLRIEVERE
jgi:hypothetical protein